MDASDFEGRLGRLTEGAQRRSEPSARIVYARYAATLDSGFRLSGQGEWHIARAGSDPVFLELDDLAIALQRPHWISTGESADDSMFKNRAFVGAAEHESPALYVDRDGTVAFDWAIAGVQSADQSWNYELSFPHSASHRLELTLPAEIEPSMEGAIISAAAGEDGGQRRWSLDLVGKHSAQLQLARVDGSRRNRPNVLVRPRLTYELSPRGLQLTVDCRLDVYGGPLHSIEFDLDPALTVLAVTRGDTPIPWTLPKRPDNKSQQRLAVNFSEPLQGQGRSLRIVAVAPLRSEPGWRLPGVLIRDAIWQDGSAVLVVAAPLTLKQLDLMHYRQTKRETLPAPAAGEAIELQALSSAAEMELYVAPSADRLESRSGTTVDLLGNEAVGVYTAEIIARQGTCFELTADISPEWIVDSVQSSPTGLVADWRIRRESGAASRLILQLARAIDQKRPLHLTVEATRRRAPLGDTLSLADLKLLSFENVTSLRRLAWIKPGPTYRLDVGNAADLTRLDPARLDAADRALFREVPQGLLFMMDDAAADLQLRLLPERPGFSASLDTHVLLRDREIIESHRIQINPESNEIDRLLVHFSQPREAELVWEIDHGDIAQLSAHRLPSDAQSALGYEGGETWELTFKPPPSKPLLLKSHRSRLVEDLLPVSLPSVRDATSQQGKVEVELATEFVPDLQARGLKPLAAGLAPPDSYQNLAAAYQYAPSEDLLVAKEPALVINFDRTSNHRRPAWIWNCEFDAWFSASPRIQQRAICLIENRGRSQFALTVPSDSLPSVKLDGASTSAWSWNQEPQELRIDLPANRRFCRIEVLWNGGDSSLDSISSPSITWPTADIPILHRQANVWLPSGYLLADLAGAQQVWSSSSVAWRERLFGILGRPSHRSTFEPWNGEDWSQIASPADENRLALEWARRFADQALPGDLLEPSSDRTADAATTWGPQLHLAWYNASAGENSPPVTLLVHLAALETASIRPARSLSRSTEGMPPSRRTMGDLLRRHGLVLLVSRGAALLTSRQWATTWCDRSIGDSREMVIDCPGGDFLTRPFASPDEAARQLIPLDTWLDLQASNSSAWPSFASDQGGDLASDGWVATPIEWPADNHTVPLFIIHKQTLLALSAGILLLTAGAAWRLASWPLVLRLIILGVLAMTALLLPAQFATLGAAAVLGFVAGMGLCAVLAAAPSVSKPETVSLGAAAVASSLLLLTLTGINPLRAQQAAPVTGAQDSTPIYDVLIPIDDHENVIGDKVYVPEALYVALLSGDKPHDGEHRYLITKAEYQAPVGASVDLQQTSASKDWQALLSIHVLRAPARVYLPLGSAGAQIVPDSATVNGRPLRFAWDNAQKSVMFELESAGAAEVEFNFRPNRHEEPRGVSFSFAIPKIPESQLFVPLAESTRAPSIAALGGLNVSEKHRLVANLGPLDQVHLARNGPSATAPASPQFDTQELAWLTLRPGSAQLDARFTIHVRRDSLQEISLVADPRLIPLPPLADSPIESIQRVSQTELLVRLVRPLADSSALDLAFAVQGATGAGRYPWPQIKVAGAQVARRYIAYTVDPSLELVSPVPAAIKPLNAVEFATLWGETEARPQAFALPAGASPWELEVRPRLAKVASRCQSLIDAHSDHVELRWQASLDISGRSRFQLRLAVPPNLIIEGVEVRDTAGARPARWALGESGLVTVFLDTAVTGRLYLVLLGRVRVADDGRVSVPCLKIEGADVEQSQLTVVRRSTVQVTIDNRRSFRELDDAAIEALLATTGSGSGGDSKLPASGGERLVAALDAGQTQEPLVLAIKRNSPRVDARQAVSLSRPNDSWRATLDLALNIADGVLDSVRIELPSSWSDPLRIDPDMPYELVDVAGGRRQLVLRPDEPLAGAAHLRIEGRLAPPSAGPLRVPDARLLGASSLEQYVVLPRQQELQTLAWETNGMRSAALPDDLARPAAEPRETMLSFAVADDAWRAELRAVERIADEVQVRLADIAINWTSDGACYGVATFDLEPAGRTSCLLALPAGYRLIHASVDERPLRITPAGGQRWRVPLGSRLPQRIEVVFAGHWSSDNDVPKVLEAPRLIGLPIERTLWTVSGPWWAGSARMKDADLVTPYALEIRRYETLAGLVDSAANTLLEIAADETPQWYAVWARRMIAARETLARLRLLEPATEWNLETTANTDFVLQDQERLAGRLGTSDLLADLLAAPPLDAAAAARFHASLGRPHSGVEAMFLGEASAIELDYSTPLRGELPWRIVNVLVAAAVLLAAVATVRYAAVVSWFGARPRMIALAVGVFWWLFLSPSAAGWLIIAAAFVGPSVARRFPRSASRRRPTPQWRWRA
jgi:hypothetical protein